MPGAISRAILQDEVLEPVVLGLERAGNGIVLTMNQDVRGGSRYGIC